MEDTQKSELEVFVGGVVQAEVALLVEQIHNEIGLNATAILNLRFALEELGLDLDENDESGLTEEFEVLADDSTDAKPYFLDELIAARPTPVELDPGIATGPITK